ncbi:MAG TPA: hypothetical protein VLK58_18790 [Conexibacter sp.]|nr:hypothetical protein [Conexibacter sp.]
MRIQGPTIFAAGLALVLLPAAGAEAAAKKPPKPALATGNSRDGAASFRLEGRTLTVTARAGLVPGSAQSRLRLLVRCGESVTAAEETSAATLAVQGGRQVAATPRRTVLRATLSRDVAARANWCELRDAAAAKPRFAATMRLRRGRAPGCVPAGREKVVFREGIALVTGLSAEIDGEAVQYFRSCLRSRGTLLPLTEAAPSFGGSASIGTFASADSWLAWVEVRRSKDDHVAISTHVLDLAAGGKPALVGGSSMRTAYPPRVGQLLVSGSGVPIWTLVGRYDDPARPEWATLYAGDGDSEARELERVEPASALTDVALSADGTTVTWRNGGVQRSAPLGGVS